MDDDVLLFLFFMWTSQQQALFQQQLLAAYEQLQADFDQEEEELLTLFLIQEDEARKRRRRLLSIYQHGVMKRSCLRTPRPRSKWRFNRTNDLYRDLTGIWAETEATEAKKYKDLFRVSKHTFDWLHACIGDMPEMKKQTTRMRDPVPAHKRLAITLNWLAKGAYMGCLEDTWGIAKSTIQGIIHETVHALYKALRDGCVVFPEGPELFQVMTDFRALGGLPQCAGSIDGCFIPIKRPTGPWGHKYWCYKGMYAILLLAVVDARGIFTFTDIGRAGSIGDAGCFHASDLKPMLESGRWFPPTHAKVVAGERMRPYLVADAAFPLMPYMLKHYPGIPAPGTKEHAYNVAHKRTRRIVENAFGRMKARFRVLPLAKMHDPIFMTLVISVCVGLHNVCERNNDPYERQWTAELKKYEKAMERRQAGVATAEPVNSAVCGHASVARDAVATYCLHRA
jgi:DDE superfamily endonuclease